MSFTAFSISGPCRTSSSSVITIVTVSANIGVTGCSSGLYTTSTLAVIASAVNTGTVRTATTSRCDC
jgi:hypothetical protein